ncbi:MAG: hypothetical protein RIC06_00835 [Cyclobacteriaceae bacterium]
MEESNWLNECERYIGFVDIMGFKDLVARSSHSDVYGLLLFLTTNKNLIEGLEGMYINEGIIDSTDRVASVTFSDSIIFITKGNEFEDLVCLVKVLKLFHLTAVEKKIPIKGAISHGLFTANFEQSIFFGQPLIDACLLHDQLYYYGIITDNNTDKKIEAFKKSDSHRMDEIDLFWGLSPLKSGSVFHHNVNLASHPENELKNLYNSVSGIVRKYVDNTLSMFNEMRSKK